MTYTGKVMGVADDDVCLLALFDQSTVAGKFGDCLGDVAGCKRHGARCRHLLLGDHALDRRKDCIPIAAGIVRRQGVDHPFGRKKIKVFGAVAPSGRDAVERRHVDRHTPFLQQPCRCQSFLRQEHRVVRMPGDHPGSGIGFGQLHEGCSRRRGVVEYRRHSDTFGLGGDLGKPPHRKVNRRHDGLNDDPAELRGSQMANKGVLVEERFEPIVRSGRCAIQPSSEDRLLEQSGDLRVNGDTGCLLYGLRQISVVLGATAERLTTAGFSERFCAARKHVVDGGREVVRRQPRSVRDTGSPEAAVWAVET